MKIGIAADHAGYPFKAPIKKYLAERGHEAVDFGTSSDAPVDYPNVIRRLAQAISQGTLDRGIALGAIGNGAAIVANRTKGVRCAVCWNVSSAQLARAEQDANMVSLGQRMMPLEEALAIVDIWLKTPFDSGRHSRRVRLIDGE
jgi:ribose 5-phosphate isomerase B